MKLSTAFLASLIAITGSTYYLSADDCCDDTYLDDSCPCGQIDLSEWRKMDQSTKIKEAGQDKVLGRIFFVDTQVVSPPCIGNSCDSSGGPAGSLEWRKIEQLMKIKKAEFDRLIKPLHESILGYQKITKRLTQKEQEEFKLLREKYNELSQLSSDVLNSISQQRNAVETKFHLIATSIAKKRGAIALFNMCHPVYVDPSYDITTEALHQLNKEYLAFLH